MSSEPRRRHSVAIPLFLGVVASAFFAVTFVVNRHLAVQGASWEWNSSLRFFFSTPLYIAIVAARRGLGPVLESMRRQPTQWILWSTVGFVLFYAPICIAADSAPGWVVAATWQITIVCGMLAAPFLYADHRRKIPLPALVISGVILVGVALVQWSNIASGALAGPALLGAAVVLIAAISYPVGNRKTLMLAHGELDTWQRLLAMSLASLPAWFLIAMMGGIRSGLPSVDQMRGVLIVAVSSGVVATALFFAAAHRVHDQPSGLAAVEATQAAEVPFVAVGEPLAFGGAWPDGTAWVGIAVICIGVVGQGFAASRPQEARN